MSAAQLVTSAVGMTVALRRRHAFDVPFMRGDPGKVVQQSLLWGTAMSAPVTMLVTHAAALWTLARRQSPAAARILGLLGATNVAGYLAERLVRRRLTRSGWDRLESPVLIAGICLAAAMALVARGDTNRPAPRAFVGATGPRRVTPHGQSRPPDPRRT